MPEASYGCFSYEKELHTITGSAESTSTYKRISSSALALVPARVEERHFSTTAGTTTLFVLQKKRCIKKGNVVFVVSIAFSLLNGFFFFFVALHDLTASKQIGSVNSSYLLGSGAFSTN
jgi:hypothetical protein